MSFSCSRCVRASKTCRVFLDDDICDECTRFKKFYDVFVFNFTCTFSFFFLFILANCVQEIVLSSKRMRFDSILSSLFEIILMWVAKLSFFLIKKMRFEENVLMRKMRFVRDVSRERRIFVVCWESKIDFSNVITLWISARMISLFKSNVFLSLLMSLSLLKSFTSLMIQTWSRCLSLLRCSMK